LNSFRCLFVFSLISLITLIMTLLNSLSYSSSTSLSLPCYCGIVDFWGVILPFFPHISCFCVGICTSWAKLLVGSINLPYSFSQSIHNIQIVLDGGKVEVQFSLLAWCDSVDICPTCSRHWARSPLLLRKEKTNQSMGESLLIFTESSLWLYLWCIWLNLL
jgi:hypothetical protein